MATREKKRALKSLDATALMERVVALARELRAEDLVALDVRELVDYMDYLVVGTGRSSRQNQSIVEHVAGELKRGHGILPLSISGKDPGTWICLDLVDVVLHIFDGEHRDIYDLELLWADAGRVDLPPPPPRQEPEDFPTSADAGSDAVEGVEAAPDEDLHEAGDDALDADPDEDLDD